MRGFLSAILAALRLWLRPQSAPSRDIANNGVSGRHIMIASHARRYPGRSSVLELRQSQGWIVATQTYSHQDRRA